MKKIISILLPYVVIFTVIFTIFMIIPETDVTENPFESTLTSNITITISPTVMITPTPMPTEIIKPTPVKKRIYNIKLSKDLQEYTRNICKKSNWNFELILGLLYVESNFKIKCRSHNRNGTTDKGIAQINSGSVSWYRKLVGKSNFSPYNPYHAIDGCVKSLNYYRKFWRSKGISENVNIYVLNSYNMGVGGYRKYLRHNGISRSYDRKVYKYRNFLLEK